MMQGLGHFILGRLKTTCVCTIADISHNQTIDVGVLFRGGVLFSIEYAKFWPILALMTNFGYFVANLRAFGCTLYRP